MRQKSVLFICHGNICRSPMAEFILKNLAHKAGFEGCFEIESAATSREEIGNDMYPPARRILRENGVPFESRRARQVTADDMERFDLIVVMDDNNLRNLQRMFGSRFVSKTRKLMTYAAGACLKAGSEADSVVDSARDVSDPWYTGDFEQAYEDILSGCKGLLEEMVALVGNKES